MKAAEKWDGLFTDVLIDSYLEYRKIDIAVVATPDTAHYITLKQILNSSLKLVICEKPICDNIIIAREIVELYKRNSIPLMVNYTRRFIPHYDYLIQYGRPLYGICVYNRGLLHTASHATDFFDMVGCEKYELHESQNKDRVWALAVIYENYTFTEVRVGDQPVWNYYDYSHRHVVKNAYNFLEGREPIKCDGDMALRALEKCYELMK